MSMESTSQVCKAKEELEAEEEGTKVVVVAQAQHEEAHPYAFHVSGPRNLTNLNWRDLISSSWWVYPFHLLL